MSGDKKGVWYWLKTSVLFVARGVLFVLGMLSLVTVVKGQFENSLSFWEISTLEVLFWFVFCFISIRHYRRCRSANLKVPSIIYKPVRNLGWVTFVLLAVVSGMYVVDPDFNFDPPSLSPFANLVGELASSAIVLACVYWASPSVKDNADTVESSMGAAA